MIINNSHHNYFFKLFAIGLFLGYICVSSIVAQPTSSREFPPISRKAMTQDHLEKISKITSQINNDKSNLELYRERLKSYSELLELNFDNETWILFANNYEADLSKIIELDQTAENYHHRGNFLTRRLNESTMIKAISDLYPSNQFVDKATRDFFKATKLNSSPKNLQGIYTSLSILYLSRPQNLVAPSNLSKWRDKVVFKWVKADLDNSIKYSQLALQAGSPLPFAETLKSNLYATYLLTAEIASKLGEKDTAQKYMEAAEKYK